MTHQTSTFFPSLPIELHLAILELVATGQVRNDADDELSARSSKLSFGLTAEERAAKDSRDLRGRAETQETLRRCSLVCWGFNAISTSLLYGHPFIHNPSRLFPFVQTLTCHKQHRSLLLSSSHRPTPLTYHLRSLTILPLPQSLISDFPRFLTDILALLSLLSTGVPNLTSLSLPPAILSTATPFSIPGGHSRFWAVLDVLAPRLEHVDGLCMRKTVGGVSGQTRYINAFLARCSRLRSLEMIVETPYHAYEDKRVAGLPASLRKLTVVLLGEGKGARNNLQPVLTSLGGLGELERLTLRGLDCREEAEGWIVGDEEVEVREAAGRLLFLGKERGSGLKELRLEELVLDEGCTRKKWVGKVVEEREKRVV